MRLALAAASLFAIAACETTAIAPTSPETALDAYYASIPDSALPKAPQGRALPGDEAAITRILVGSCNDEEKESKVLATIAGEQADLFLMLGDNVYGDRDGRAYAVNDPELTELRESFADLAARSEFKAVRAAHPMMVAWDDHDYGANDAGGDFAFRKFAERIHEVFWGLDTEDAGAWPGTYHARTFGPQGERVQVIVLDTRAFRSPLTPTDEWGAAGKQRYLPAPETQMQDMLGSAQWTWLENQLQKPADVRLIASSIQVLTSDGHGYEHWSNLPVERQRLFDLIDNTGANGVVFLSGDRHTSFLYSKSDVIDYPVHELTASSMNVSFATQSDERDSAQIGAGYPPENFGAVAIDWAGGQISLSIHDADGQMVRETRFPIPGYDDAA